MIASEKDLEDYICDNQEEFMNFLAEELDVDPELKFVGRQVKIGNDNICDLLYEYEYNKSSIYFIVVELKFRELEVKDLAQISRYLSVLNNKIHEKNKDFPNAVGVFVSFGLSKELQEISSAKILDDIYFVKIKPKLYYEREKYSKREEYIKSVELDSRIEEIYGKE